MESIDKTVEDLIGQKVVAYCARFIYCGKLVAADGRWLVLDNAEIVYDTGEHSKDKARWAASEPTWTPQWRISVAAIESLGRAPF